jgi:hypothetical protein
VAERLDEQKIATLRLWADGLAREERDELRAAARAILLLIDEVELLHVELWHAGLLHTPEDEGTSASERPSLRSVLRERIRTSAEKASGPPQPDPGD